MEEFQESYKEGIIKKEEIEQRMDGWFAYAVHGNTYDLCNKLRKEIKNM